MKQSQKDENFLNKSIARSLNHRLREGFFIVGMAVCVFLFLALMTYHQNDPGWSQTGKTSHVINAGGKAGAWFADAFLYLFGYMAYLFPVTIAYLSWRLVRRQKKETETDEPNYYLFATRIIGFFILLTASDGLVSLHFLSNKQHLPFHAGGILGRLIETSLINTFNDFGTTVILLGTLFCGVTLFSGLSWLGLLEVIGRATLNSLQYVVRQCHRIYQCIYQYISSKRQDLLKRSTINIEEERFQPRAEPPKISMRSKIPKYIPPSEKAASVNVPDVSLLGPSIPTVKETKPTRTSFKKAQNGKLPSISLLDRIKVNEFAEISREKLENMSCEVEARLFDFGVEAKVVAVHPGPVITRFEIQLAPGVKVSKISNLAKDLARSLSTISVRIVEVIPGKAVIGLEIPNVNRQAVRLHEVLDSEQYQHARSPISLALGKDIAGHPVVVDLGKMPHLLVAGTTGSGKSVALNAMLLSLLFKATPDQARLILIDPKMLELSIYEGVPHLLTPVVTDMKEAANALRWCVAEMDRRYRLMASLGVRSLANYNNKVQAAIDNNEPIKDPTQTVNPDDEPVTLEPLPYIVVVVDEFADMMMVVGKKVEELIARIAQKARAAGIHMILATQRPSVDVITGLIKSNIPTRISFQVSSKIDSRTILDQQGAEQLLGQGDMLYLPPGSGVPVRVHGAFVADHEVHNVVEGWKQYAEPEYLDEVLEFNGESSQTDPVLMDDENGETDPLYDQAVRIVTETRRATISSVQRRLKIGYNRAARLLETMEAAGIVTKMESNGSRDVLAPPPVDIES